MVRLRYFRTTLLPVMRVLCTSRDFMDIRNQKIILLTILIANAIGWLPITFFGAQIFAPTQYVDLANTLYFLATIIGLASLSIGIYSGLKFPLVSGFTLINFIVGFSLVLASGFVLYLSTLYFLSLISLAVAGFIIMRQYWLVHNKHIKSVASSLGQ